MDPDKYQQAWKTDAAQNRVTIDANLLLKEVQRHQRNFQAAIFWRDFREVGVALLMLPYWFYQGIRSSLPWTWYLTVPALVWVIGFILVDRRRHPQKPSEPGNPLLHSVQESLTQLEHQIWLLRNVFWWYLLPFSISIMAFFVHVSWLASSDWWEFLIAVLLLGLVLFVMYGLIYFLNQRCVRTALQPRREELLALLASLKDETTTEDEQLPFANPQGTPPMNNKNLIEITLVVLFLAATFGILYVFRHSFSGNRPNVQYSSFAEAAKDGLAAFERADYDTAIAAWDEAIRLDPNHSEIHRWRGDASLNKHQYDKALSEYDEAIRLDPENGMAHCSRGVTWTEKRESDKAIADFDEAIRLDPSIANMPFYKRYRKAAESRRPVTPMSPRK